MWSQQNKIELLTYNRRVIPLLTFTMLDFGWSVDGCARAMQKHLRSHGAKLKCHDAFTHRQKIKHGKTVHVCWKRAMDTFFQEMLGGAGRLQENGGVTLFLQHIEDDKKKVRYDASGLHRESSGAGV